MNISVKNMMDKDANDIEVLIFKTNINSDTELTKISKVLNDQFNILEWTIDREDIDKVLRIESIGLKSKSVIEIITMEGFHCEELPD
jgi:hypothetical protein